MAGAAVVCDEGFAAELRAWRQRMGGTLFAMTPYALSALVGLLPVGARGEAWLRLALVAHGAATEFLQTFVEGRYGSATDVAIDAAGVTLGWASVWLWRWLRSRTQSPSPAAPSP